MTVDADSTSQSLYVYFVDDDGGTAPGEPTTGLLFSDIETGGSASYMRQGAARVDFTLKTLANAASAYDAGGFLLVDDTNMPGLYRVDVPDAALATGVAFAVFQLVAAGAKNTVMRPLREDISQLGADWINAGRLDAILDARMAEASIATTGGAVDVVTLVDTTTTNTDVRGTDSAATAASLAVLTNAFVLTSAVIETVTSQTQLVLPATADAVEDNAYHGAIAVLIDDGDANNKSFQVIEGYTASTRTVTLARAPTFTVTTSDVITILATTDAGGVWDMALTGAKHNLSTSAGKRLRQLEEAFVHASGTIAAVGSGHSITLDTGAVATADYYIGDRLQITEGLGAGQSRLIKAYTSGRVATLDSDYTVNPDTASLYDVVAADVHVSLSDADLASGFVTTATSTTTLTLDAGAVATTDYYVGEQIVFTHGTGAGQSREITAYTSGRVVTMSPALTTAVSTDTVWHIQVTVSIPEIVNEIWDEDPGDHQTADTFGQAIGDPNGNTETMYDAVITDAAGTNVAADLIVVDTEVGQVKVATDKLTFTVANQIDSNPLSINGVAAAAAGLALSADTILNGTASGTPTTTTMVSDIGISVDSQLNGRIIIFADDTTTANLRDQATDITACTASSNTLTFTELTTAPVSGDTFVIV